MIMFRSTRRGILNTAESDLIRSRSVTFSSAVQGSLSPVIPARTILILFWEWHPKALPFELLSVSLFHSSRTTTAHSSLQVINDTKDEIGAIDFY